MARGAALSSRGRFGAGPPENLLCRLGLPRALAAGDRASREKPLFLPRGGPRGGGDSSAFRIGTFRKGRCQADAIAHEQRHNVMYYTSAA